MLSEQDYVLLNRVQKDFPVCRDPFSIIAQELGMEKSAVISRLRELKNDGMISRFGGVANHEKMGVSTLAALAVDPHDLDSIAAMVNAYDEVNHNYVREHRYNLWFVITAKNQRRLQVVLAEIKKNSACKLIDLPMLKNFHIDLAFKL